MKRVLILAGAAAAFVMLSGCTTMSALTSDLAVELSSGSTTQAKTLGEANELAADVWKGIDKYAVGDYGTPDAAVLKEIQLLAAPIHAALQQGDAAQKAGNSPAVAVALAAFNEAMAAMNTYEAQKGILNCPC